jgi:hypothetical protein
MYTEKAIGRWTLIAMTAMLIQLLCMATAHADDWKQLGQTTVKRVSEKDEIVVGADEGKFRKIKLEVHGADVEIIKLTVTYGDGDKDNDINVKDKIKDGKETRAIDLEGGERVIRKVVLFYKTDADENRKARVVLFGRD